MRTYQITLETKDCYHIESFIKEFQCLPLALDWAKLQIGKTHKNGSEIGRVIIVQDDEDEGFVVDENTIL